MKKIDSDLLDELDDTLENSFDDLLGEEEPQSFSWLKTVGVCVVLVLMVMGGFWLYQSYSDRETMQIATSQDVLAPDANDVKKEDPVNINPLKEQRDNDLSSTLEQEKKPVYRSSTDTQRSKQDVSNKKETMDLSSMKLDQHAFYRVVVGPFENYQMAQQQLRQIKSKNLDGYVWVQQEDDLTIYRVQLGAFKEKARALFLKKKITQKGFSSYILRK